jgi:hypothetical protein
VFRAALRLVLIASLLFAMTPPRLFGCACCDEGQAQAPVTDAPGSPCCCCDCTEQSCDQPTQSTPKRSPSKSPCKPGCIHWCCGAGFVPLTTVAAAPLLEQAAEASLALPPALPLDGFRPRIEHPPRSL